MRGAGQGHRLVAGNKRGGSARCVRASVDACQGAGWGGYGVGEVERQGARQVFEEEAAVLQLRQQAQQEEGGGKRAAAAAAGWWRGGEMGGGRRVRGVPACKGLNGDNLK